MCIYYILTSECEKNLVGVFEVVTDVYTAGCYSPVGRKDDMPTKDVPIVRPYGMAWVQVKSLS